MAIPMAPELGINGSDFWSNIPSEILEQISLVFNLGAIVLIATVVYFVVLLIIKIAGFIFGFRKDKNLKKISESLDIANRRLEEIAGLLSRKRGEREDKKKKDG